MSTYNHVNHRLQAAAIKESAIAADEAVLVRQGSHAIVGGQLQEVSETSVRARASDASPTACHSLNERDRHPQGGTQQGSEPRGWCDEVGVMRLLHRLPGGFIAKRMGCCRSLPASDGHHLIP